MSYGDCTNSIISYPHLNPYANIQAEVQNLEVKLYYKDKELKYQRQEIRALINTIGILEKEISFKHDNLRKRKQQLIKSSENFENYNFKYKKLFQHFVLIKNSVEEILKKIISLNSSLAEIDKISINESAAAAGNEITIK